MVQFKNKLDVFGGDKLSSVVYTAEKRLKKYEGGTFFDVLREVYKISDEDIMEITEKYLEFLNSPSFVFRLEKETFHKFLQSDLDELDKQFDRFDNIIIKNCNILFALICLTKEVIYYGSR